MFQSRIALILATVLLTTTVITAQSPHLERTRPTGPQTTDAAAIEFEAKFSEPVVNGFVSEFAVSGSFAGSATIATESAFRTQPRLTSSAHRAVATTGITFGSDWTVEFWYRADVAGTERSVFSYASAGVDNEIAYFIDGDVWVAGVKLVTGVAPAVANEWRHIAITGGATSIKVYVNGALSSDLTTSLVVPSGGTLVLGDDQDSLGGSFSSAQAFLGRIDDVRIWSTARTQTEIAAEMFAPIDPTTTGLAHAWSFDAVADLGEGTAGANDVADLVGGADLSLENGLDLVNGGTPADTWYVTVDTAGITGPGTVFVDAALGLIEDFDGNLLVANPDGGAVLAAALFEPCTAPVVVAQPATAPTANAFPHREIVFDRPVKGLTPSDLEVGGVAPSGATIPAVSTPLRNGLSFNSTGSVVRIPGPGLYNFPNAGTMTFECWMKSTKADGALLSYATSASQSNTLLIQAGGRVWVDNAVVFPSIDLGQLDGEWHHFAVTRDALGTMRRYIDGIPAGEKTGASSLNSNWGYLVFGQDQDNFGGGFQAAQALEGEMDEIRIWSNARSAQVIAANRFDPVSPSAPGLHAYYGCEQLEAILGPAPNDLRDLSLNSQDLDTSGITTTARVDMGSLWTVDITFPSVTAFLEVDLAPGHGVTGLCGLPAVGDPSGAPAIEHVYVEDLTTDVSVNGAAPEPYHAVSTAGDQLLIRFESPGGLHDWDGVPSFFGQLIATGTEPGDAGVVGFPELRLDLLSPSGPFVIFDGNTDGPFAPTFMPPGGITFASAGPVGLGGFSLACQPIVASSTTTSNGIFATGNVLVIDL